MPRSSLAPGFFHRALRRCFQVLVWYRDTRCTPLCNTMIPTVQSTPSRHDTHTLILRPIQPSTIVDCLYKGTILFCIPLFWSGFIYIPGHTWLHCKPVHCFDSSSFGYTTSTRNTHVDLASDTTINHCRLSLQRYYSVLYTVVLIGIYLHSWAYMVTSQIGPLFWTIYCRLLVFAGFITTMDLNDEIPWSTAPLGQYPYDSHAIDLPSLQYDRCQRNIASLLSCSIGAFANKIFVSKSRWCQQL